MCDPITLAATAAVAGGGLLEAKQAADNNAAAVKARQEEQRREIARQHAYQQQSAAALSSTLDHFQPQAQQQAQTEAQTQRREATAPKEASAAPTAAALSLGSAPKEVRDSLSSTISDAVGRSRRNAQSLADLGAFGSTGFGNDLALNQGQRSIGTIGNFAGGSASLLPASAAEAAANSQSYSPIPTLLKTGGQLAGLYGFSRLPAAKIPGQSLAGGSYNPLSGLYGRV